MRRNNMPPEIKAYSWDHDKDCKSGRLENLIFVPVLTGSEPEQGDVPVRIELERRPGVPGVLAIVYKGDHEIGAQG